MKITAGSLQLSASDLAGHLNCHHLTQLDYGVATGTIAKPKIWDPALELLWQRGAVHEQQYLDHLQKAGSIPLRIEGIDITPEAMAQTLEAMKAGVPVIVQGALSYSGWGGRIDVLRRVDGVESSFGNWSYEAIDTKLARETKGGTILQLCLYSDLVAQAQGTWPEFMSVVVPWSDFEPQQYRVSDYAAYYRRVKAGLHQAVAAPSPATYPEPKEHCEICRWRWQCDQRRRDDDHLSLVAGISKLQINELGQHQIVTTEGLAALPLPFPWRPERGSLPSYQRIREQARIQIEGRKAGQIRFELLPIEPGFGLTCLPEPSEGDIFFDLEGDPFVGDGGLEYLFGYQFKGSDGSIAHVADWAFSRADEKRIFESFVDLVMTRWTQYPGLHIYHYAPYEPSALKRLMGRYATREEEVDKMLRGQLFVDLYGVSRHAIRASVESYSIKKLEPLYGFEREVELTKANVALINLQSNLELNDAAAISAEDAAVVEGYNRDDCSSTLCLRDWLESLRAQCIANGHVIDRPKPSESTATEDISDWVQKIDALMSDLTAGIPADVSARTEEQQARWILANILDWHRREQKAVWWEFFRLAALSAEELLDERQGLSGLVFLERVGGTDKAPIHRYRFPPQETEFRGGEPLMKPGGDRLGSVDAIDFKGLYLDIKKRQDSANIHPTAVFAHNVVDTQVQADSLVRIGEYVAALGMIDSGPFQAARDLLLKHSPRLGGEPLRKDGETALEAAVRVTRHFEGGVFPIQGPPGVGKTFTGARMICELVKSGKRVGITANSHKVIRNLIDGVIEAADESNISLQCIQKAGELEDPKPRLSFAKSNSDLLDALNAGVQVAGATAWFWARTDAFEAVDVLFVDEAAQMSLANVLAVSQAATTVVLIGDPRQLDQPTQGAHPDGTGVSALDHILDGEQTISANKGLFLEETWRLHPDICAFTSELFYDNKLHSRKGLKILRVSSSGPVDGVGLRFIPIAHSGNQNVSREEAEAVEHLVNATLSSGARWTNRDGIECPVKLEDILIIAPYNAQVFEIQQRLPGARVGTVDKFQGQEAPIAIYSLATSSQADAPRGMEFLYSLNRLNVATSRAKCISVVVASPDVFEAECRTPRQIHLANAFCRFREMAFVFEGSNAPSP